MSWRSELASRVVASSTWQGEGLKRDLISFRSGEIELYGSLYAGAEVGSGPAVVICPPWGVEARQADWLARSLARGAAACGGAALVFDWPGQGESGGEPEQITLEDLIAAAGDAAAVLRARCDRSPLVLAGIRVGAAVAALATSYVSADALILMQPVWDLADHFASVEKASARAALGKSAYPGWAFGFPLPSLESFASTGDRVIAAVENYAGSKVALQHGSDEPAASIERIDVPGEWRHSVATNDSRLTDAAREWLVARQMT